MFWLCSLFVLYQSSGGFCVFSWLLFGKTRLGKKNPYIVRKTHGFFGKNLFMAACLLGRPVVILGRTCCLFGACWGSWPLLRLQSAVNLGKTLLREKTFIVRKNPWPFGQTFRKNPLFIWGKTYFRKTHYFVRGKKSLGKPVVVFGKNLFFLFSGLVVILELSDPSRTTNILSLARPTLVC